METKMPINREWLKNLLTDLPRVKCYSVLKKDGVDLCDTKMCPIESKCVVCCAVLSCSVMSDSLRPHGLQPARLLCPWGFSRQEYWSGLPCRPPGDLPDPEIEPVSPALQADSLPRKPLKASSD